ncbi:hypothetical protein ATK74_3009 [Propionicimonas paludicola]|uniref:Uncharacterized protein n=1 Tax=Propionicimonas paludicola TaxID=185243 RepID=A0A2A9CWB3_9ACTN|nr:hypothetical protein [Propionicimonas paludicola]PFG18421.1 hypothetical protein ATK74_3009 [Propionicimonas paludicola]
MSHPLRRTLLPAVLFFVLAGCAVTPPNATQTPPTTPSSLSPSPSPVATTPAASPTQTPSQTPAANTVELAGNGLGGLKFGTPEKTVAQLLTTRLGAPDERMEGVLCELNDAAPWAATVTYGGLWVQYQAKTASKKAPRTLSAWGFQLKEPFAAPLVIAGDVPLDLNFAELKKQFPDGKLTDSELGDGGQIFTLANGLTFMGYDGQPDTVMAGPISYCD